MSRGTEDDDAAVVFTELKNRGFVICELKPVEHPTYLEGDAKEYTPIDERRAKRVLAMTLLALAEQP